MITEEELKQQEQDWAKEKKLLKRKIRIDKERKKMDTKANGKKFTTTKLLIFFLFLNCTLIEIFTGWATVKSIEIALLTGIYPDFSPLVTLIGSVVSEVIGFGVYAAKSAKENSRGGIIYDSALGNEDAVG
jgi:hypothetical protein